MEAKFLKGKGITLSILLLLAFGLNSPYALAADKLRFGIPKGSATLVTPVVAAQEKGFWRENGLEVEWYAFRSGAEVTRAIVARSLNMGFEAAAGSIMSHVRGIPLVLVADLAGFDYYIYVPPDSKIKEPQDLKGAKIAVRFGSMAHAYAKFLARRLGLEQDLKLVALGGFEVEMAALKTGHIQGVVRALQIAVPLKLKGEVREAISISHYFPKEWIETSVVAPRWFIEEKPEVIRRAVKAVRQAVDYIRSDRSWSVDTIRKELNYSQEEAVVVYDSLRYSPGGRVSPRAVENLLNFLIDYGLIPREKRPRIEDLYTTRFVP